MTAVQSGRGRAGQAQRAQAGACRVQSGRGGPGRLTEEAGVGAHTGAPWLNSPSRHQSQGNRAVSPARLPQRRRPGSLHSAHARRPRPKDRGGDPEAPPTAG